jgi:hypothetical protein
MRLAVLLCLLAALPASAQDQAVQRALIQRQQQSDAFSLQLHQSQELLAVPASGKQAAESRQFSERQRLDNLNAQQLRDVRPELSPELRPYERQAADGERRRFISPIVEVPAPSSPASPPAKLEPSLKGNVTPIAAPAN